MSYNYAIIFIEKKEGFMVQPTASYKIDDKVSFIFDGKEYEGIIAIVDAFGIFFDNSEPYYDIYIKLQKQKILVKHVPQSCMKRIN